VYVVLKEYLARLETLEATKPDGQRRVVPSMATLARAAGVHPMTISRWVTGETKATTHSLLASVIETLRAHEFDTEIGDILAYRQETQM
jgi:hypothetical protein